MIWAALALFVIGLIARASAQTSPQRIDDVSPGPNAKPGPGSTQWGRMLALAGSGKEVMVGSAASWQTRNGNLMVEHLAARAPNGDLLVFYWTPDADWKVVNVTSKTGQKVASAATSWQTPNGNLLVEHLGAQAPNGDLLVFYWMPGSDWKVVDASSKASSRILYSASQAAGVWRSDDYGATWHQLTRPQPAEGAYASGALGAPLVLDVAVSTNNPDVVLAAVVDQQTTNAAGSGIYRSTDGGNIWTLVHHPKDSNGRAQQVTQIRFAPDDPKLVCAAVGVGIGISTDAGGQWKDVAFDGLGNSGVWHIAIAPKESEVKRRVYAAGDGLLWYSADGGEKWTQDHGLTLPPTFPQFGEAPSFLPFGEATTIFNGTAAQILEVEPGHPDHLYLAYKYGANGPRYFAQYKGVLLTETDGAECRTIVTLTPEHQQKVGQQSLFVGAGEGSVWLGDYSAFQPSAASQSAQWVRMPGPPVYWGVSTPSGRTYLKVHATASGYLLFFADRSHLHMSVGRPTAGGWHRLDGLDISETWWKANKERTGGFLNTLKMHVDPHAILPSPDFDVTLKKPSAEIPATYAKNLVLDRFLGGRLFVANDGGIYVSADGGNTWPPVYDGPHTLICVNIAGTAIAGKGPALYMGTGDNDDFFTTDGGKSWQDVCGACGDCDHWFANQGQPSRVVELGAPGRKGEYIFYYTGSSGAYPNAADPAQQKSHSYPSDYALDLNNGSRLLVQSLAGETAPSDGDLFMIQKKSSGSRVLVRAKDSISGPSSFNQVGPTLPVNDISRVQASGGHKSTVFYVGNGTGLWRGAVDGQGLVSQWDSIVPRGVANVARRFFANPYDSKNVYIVDSDGVKRSDDGGTSWLPDAALNARLTGNGTLNLNCWDSLCVFNDLVVDRNNSKRRFAIGLLGVFCTSDGINWRRLLDTRALPSVPRTGFYDPISNPQDPSLYVACDGRGVLKIHPIPQN